MKVFLMTPKYGSFRRHSVKGQFSCPFIFYFLHYYISILFPGGYSMNYFFSVTLYILNLPHIF